MNVLIRLCLLLAVTLIPFLGVSQSPYTLTIESFPSTQEGLTSYRFYVGLQEAEDACFSVFGNQELPMWFSMSEGHIQFSVQQFLERLWIELGFREHFS